MSDCGRMVIAVEEAKKKAGCVGTWAAMDDIKQLATYMFSAVAYSQWGLGQKPGSECIIGLLIYPNIIYRLSIWKPNEEVFGFMHRIEYADTPRTMGWILEDFLQRYIQDYDRLKLASGDYDHSTCEPHLWTCLNFNLGSPMRGLHLTNLGFLFRSNTEILREFLEKGQTQALELDFCVEIAQIPPKEPLILKYLSALLVTPPDQYAAPIEEIIRAEKLARLNNRLASSEGGIARGCEENLGANGELDSDAVNSESVSEPACEPAALSQLPDTCLTGVKHPYLGIVTVNVRHHIIVMRDAGPSLDNQVGTEQFQARWKRRRELRSRFAADIGESALNLVTDLGLCHNDIRTPNIALRGESFCLLDFDLSRRSVAVEESRVARRFKTVMSPDSKMMYTIAQIALVVFEIECHPSQPQVSNVRKYWLYESDLSRTKPAIKGFETWLESKGREVEHVFTEEAEGSRTSLLPNKAYFLRVLNAILEL